MMPKSRRKFAPLDAAAGDGAAEEALVDDLGDFEGTRGEDETRFGI